MSGILKSRKKRILMVLLILGIAALALVGMIFKWGSYIWVTGFFLFFAGIGFFALNELVIEKMKQMREPFGDYSKIRNVDYLIIGDFCNVSDYVPEDASFVRIAAPDRGREASFQILMHTHSILKEEGGTVIMAIGSRKKNYTVFDIPFFHPITIKKLHLEGLSMRSKFPVFFSPVNCIRFLKGYSNVSYVIVHNMDADLKAFCDERKYGLIELRKI